MYFIILSVKYVLPIKYSKMRGSEFLYVIFSSHMLTYRYTIKTYFYGPKQNTYILTFVTLRFHSLRE